VGYLKANWVGTVAAALTFASLLLPLLSISLYQLVGTFPNLTRDYSLNAGLSIFYFGIVGHANGVTQILLFPYWFNWFFCAILIIAGSLALKGSLAKRTTGRKLMALAGVLAMICSPLFYFAFVSTLLSQPFTSNNALFFFFTPSSFRLSDTVASSFHTRIVNPSFYWLPVISGILAIISLKVFKE
jgi:hypothetical protein